METIHEFDGVLLADGREGAVVEILGEQDIFLIDVGTSPKDWETIEVSRKDIIKVQYSAHKRTQ